MATWSLKDTYALVRKAFGTEQERLAKASTQSVVDRQNFARYHFSEARRLQKSFEQKYLGQNLLIDPHGQNTERSRVAFEVFMVKAGAHATAAIQSVHAIPDILAHAVYYSAVQQANPPALPDREVAVNTVARLLARTSELAVLARMLRQSHAGESWRHLAAVANTSKHRSVVRATLSEDWTGTRKNFRELHISAFEREGRGFPAVSLQALLEPEYNRLSRLVIEIGHALTAHLRAIAG
jgi:hypothetical protein